MTKRAEDRNFHFTYKATCTYNNRIFYGHHSTDDLADGFAGQGSSLYMSIKNHGRNLHLFERIEIYPTRSESKSAYNELKASQLQNPQRPEDRKYHFVYKTTRFDGKYYIGIHSTDNLNDGYKGSGTYIGRSLKKHGFDNHKIQIMEYCKTRDEAFAREGAIVTPEVLSDPLCMNQTPGGRHHGNRVYGFTDESLILIGKAAKKAHEEGKFAHLKGRKQKEEHVARRAAANTGKKRTAEQKLNLNNGQAAYYETADPEILKERGKKSAVTRKERGSAFGGRPKGIQMSEEQKQRQSELMRGDNRMSVRASCLHCKKETTATAITQFHGKCK